MQSSSSARAASGTDAADVLSISKATEHMIQMDSDMSGPGVALGGTFEGKSLETETEKDIEMSRKRREANDRYFEKVNKGVLEVVNRLEEVAKAMKGVESESKEIWGQDSGDAESVLSAPSVT